VAADDRQLAVEGDTLTADIAAGGEARVTEVDGRRDVATAVRVDTAGEAADRAAAARTVSLLADTLVEVIDLNVIVDLITAGHADAAVEAGRHVNLNTVLMDLNIRVLIHPPCSTAEARARVEDTPDDEAELHVFIELSTIDNANSIGVLSLESSAGGHFSKRFTPC